MNGNLPGDNPLGQEKEEKPTATCLGLTRQELIKIKRLNQSAIFFSLAYISLGLYIFILHIFTTLKLGKRNMMNIDRKIIINILIPVYVTNFWGKILTFYSSYASSAALMRLTSLSQLAAFFLDIFFFVKVVQEGHKIGSGFVYDDLLLILFVYLCVVFDIIYLFSSMVLSVQLTIYGFIAIPLVTRIPEEPLSQ